MALVSLTEAKDQLKFDDDVPEGNLGLALAAAEGYVIGAIGADLSDTAYEGDEYIHVRATAKEAILMLTAQWHTNPTGGEKREEPSFGIKALITQAATGVI